MGNATDKPVLLTEYGVDAYHDACGTNDDDPCYNTFDDTVTDTTDKTASYEVRQWVVMGRFSRGCVWRPPHASVRAAAACG